MAMRTRITIETGMNDNDEFCLSVETSKHEYEMPVTPENVEEIRNALNNAIIDIERHERRMMADPENY